MLVFGKELLAQNVNTQGWQETAVLERETVARDFVFKQYDLNSFLFLIYIFKLSSYHLAVSFWEHLFLWFNYVLREKSGWIKPINSSDLFITLNGGLEGTFTNSKHVLWVFYIVPLIICTAIDTSAYVSLRCDIWYLQVHISYSNKGYKLEF